jgi:RNA polymerase sigma factor (sigma-70 family)
LPVDSINHKELFKKISDISIIEGVRKQDDKILNWLYDNYLKTVKKYVLDNSGSADDVSDVFQESIIVLYTQITEDKLNLTTDLKGYFFGIVRNVWNAQLRKMQKTTDLDVDISDEDDLEEEKNEVFELVVAKAFQKLKPEQQKILRLYSEGRSYEEIANEMGLINEEYARRKKYLCKEALLDLMKEDPDYYGYLGLKK